MIQKTMPKYKEVEATRPVSKNTGNSNSNSKDKGKGKPTFKPKTKGKGKVATITNNNITEDEDMEDAPPMDDEHTMVSLNEMDYELTNAGNTPTVVDKGKGKVKNPVKFGELPIVGGKKGKEAQGNDGKETQGKKDDDDEKAWKKFFLGA
jgi:hypothetical protein